MSDTVYRIGIDIDDVLADTIGATRVWAHEKTNIRLDPEHYHTGDDYWNYYNAIWARHGIEGLNFEDFLEELSVDQSSIKPNKGAVEAVRELRKTYEVVFITSRAPFLKEATRVWLDEHIDPSVPLYIASNPLVNTSAQSKGELCVELGVELLIDDNIGNCESANEYGVASILFGDYGWNQNAPAHMQRCLNWNAVMERIREYK